MQYDCMSNMIADQYYGMIYDKLVIQGTQIHVDNIPILPRAWMNSGVQFITRIQDDPVNIGAKKLMDLIESGEIEIQEIAVG